jgi:hypothetical protein
VFGEESAVHYVVSDDVLEEMEEEEAIALIDLDMINISERAR